MNIRIKIMELDLVLDDLISNGYTKQEAIQMIHAAAMCQFLDCIDKNVDDKCYLRVGGGITTYEY